MVFSAWRCEPAHLLDHFCQVAKHVEAVSRLQRCWSARFGSTSKFSSAVATDEEDSWVLFEPRFQGGGLTIRKQIYWLDVRKVNIVSSANGLLAQWQQREDTVIVGIKRIIR